MSLIEMSQKITEERNRVNEELREKGTQLLMDELKPLFEKYTDLGNISWVQYTPYFCDGEQCEFGVLNDELQLDGVGEYDLPQGEQRNTFAKVEKEFKTLLQQVDEDIYLAIFGDHVKVTIHRDGRSTIEEYEHE